MIALNKTVQDYAHKNRVLKYQLDEIVENFYEDDNVDVLVEGIMKMTKENQFCSAIAEKLALACQLASANGAASKTLAKDIDALLMSNLELNPTILDAYTEYSEFQFTYKGNDVAALRAVDEGIRIAKQKIKEFEEMIEKILAA